MSSVSTPGNVLDGRRRNGHRGRIMETRTFDLVVPAGTMPCYEALPETEGAPFRGAVVVVQEAFGVNAQSKT